VRTVFAVKVLFVFGKTQFRIQPRTGGGGIAFRYLHVYAQLVHIAMRNSSFRHFDRH